MDLGNISFGSWAGLAAAVTMLSAGWHNIRTWLISLGDFVIARVAIKDEAARAVLSAVFQKGRRSPFSARVYGGWRSFVRPHKRMEVVGYEAISASPVLCWLGRTPVLLKHAFGSNDVAHQYDGAIGIVSLWFIRGTLDVDAFVKRALAEFNLIASNRGDSPRKRFNVHRVSRQREMYAGRAEVGNKTTPSEPSRSSSSDPSDMLRRLQTRELRLLHWQPDDLIEQSNDQPPFDLYPFPPEALAILPEVDNWLKHEAWFRAKGVPHRRGYALYGPTGSGKSTFVRSVAIRYDLPLYVFDLASLDNASFADEWRTVQSNTPAIVLLEDLDCVFKGREFCATVSKNRDTLTFDCLLNTISGVGSNDGILLFVTTNHIDSLDPALGVPFNGHGRSTRPGRIDKTIYFGPMGETERRKLAAFILSDYPAEIEPTVAAGDGETAAQFQERCAQLALAKWNETHCLP